MIVIELLQSVKYKKRDSYLCKYIDGLGLGREKRRYQYVNPLQLMISDKRITIKSFIYFRAEK